MNNRSLEQCEKLKLGTSKGQIKEKNIRKCFIRIFVFQPLFNSKIVKFHPSNIIICLILTT